MATQGVLSIVENGKVKYKIVTGSDGYNIDELCKYGVEDLASRTPEDLYNLALSCVFGSEASLVVSYRDGNGDIQHYHKTDKLEYDYIPWYWDKFDDPKFNPRWARGDGAVTRVLHLRKGEQ